jgi:hypothetical protein
VINRYAQEFEPIHDGEAAHLGFVITQCPAATSGDDALTTLQRLLKCFEVRQFEDVQRLLEAEVRVDVKTDGQLFSPMYRLRAKVRGGTDFSVQGDVKSQDQEQSREDLLKLVADHCRGCIYEKDTNRMVGCGFDKFWEHDSKFAATSRIEWKTAEARVKMDGSIVKLYYYGKEWRVASNSMIDARKAPLAASGKTVADLFWEAAQNRIRIGNLNQNMTYVFEVCHPENRIVVYYHKPELYHLATIESSTGRDVTEQNTCALGSIARPPVVLGHGDCSLEAAIACVRSFNSQQEGLVVTDGNGLRVKIKSPHWLLVHKKREFDTPNFHLLSSVISPHTGRCLEQQRGFRCLSLSQEAVADFEEAANLKLEELARTLKGKQDNREDLYAKAKILGAPALLWLSKQRYRQTDVQAMVGWLTKRSELRRVRGGGSILEMAKDTDSPVLSILLGFTSTWLQYAATVKN